MCNDTSAFHATLNEKQFHKCILRLVCIICILCWFLPCSVQAQRYWLGDPEHEISEHIISPDSKRVVYSAKYPGHFGLFSVPLGGGEVIPLYTHSEGTDEGAINKFQISQDSQRVVFSTYNSDSGSIGRDEELNSVSINGGDISKLHHNSAQSIGSFKISRDSTSVVYLASDKPYPDDVISSAFVCWDLYSVNITGDNASHLSSDLPENNSVLNFDISRNSKKVIYSAGELVALQLNRVIKKSLLYSVPLSGGNVTKLFGPAVSGNGYTSLDFDISQDSTTVVYNIYYREENTNIPKRIELYSIPVSGGNTKMLDKRSGREGYIIKSSLQISADSKRIVYLISDNYMAGSPEGRSTIYSLPISGGKLTKLNDVNLEDSFAPEDVLITQDSKRVVYLVDQDSKNVSTLYSVAINGGDSIKILTLNMPQDKYTGGGNFRITPDSDTVLGWSWNSEGLYSTPITGGPVKEINMAVILNAYISSDSKFIAYIANKEDDRDEVFYSAIDGGIPVRVDKADVGGYYDLSISPDSSTITFLTHGVEGSGRLFGSRMMNKVSKAQPWLLLLTKE